MSYNYETGMYEGYIYKITNNINGKVYIGQTSVSIEHRWAQHKCDANSTRNNHLALYRAMKKYKANNFQISKLEQVKNITKDGLVQDLNDLEIYYIGYYNCLVPNGYNVTKGGNNTSIRYCKGVTSYFYDGNVDKAFESVADAARYYSANVSGIIRCCNGKSSGCCHRIWRYSEDSFNKFPIEITADQLYGDGLRPVDKYTLDKVFVKSYNSISEAIKDDKEIKKHSPIALCCDGVYNQAYGYIWRDRGVNIDIYEWKLNQQYVPVDAYDKDGNFLGSYESFASAARAYGVNHHTHIAECCNGKRLSCRDIIFRYKGEPFDKHRVTRKEKECEYVFNHYDLKNNYIETLYGIKALKQIGRSPKFVVQCCQGITSHVGTSKWFFADDKNNPDQSKIIGIPKEYPTNQNIGVIFDKYTHPICVYDRYGNLLGTYDNARVLSKEKLILTQTIYDICDGNVAYNKGLVFRYEGDPFYLYYTFDYTRKHINIYDKENNFIAQCFDIQECIRTLGLNTKKGSSIQKCLKNERQYAYGYQFYRVDDPNQPDKSKIIAENTIEEAS